MKEAQVKQRSEPPANIEAAEQVSEDGGAHTAAHFDKIAQAAYFRAEHRRFAPGHELDDWLAAEREVAGHPGQ
jgi:hypothetical protein